MKNTSLKNISVACLVLLSPFFLSACGKKKTTPATPPSPAPKLVEMTIDQKPYISLTPRTDGHQLTLKISHIPTDITQIEYELIYTATDGTIEMEKGVGDTLKVESTLITKNLLLGTASCTNTCKYKYDEGVTGGILSLIFINSAGQMSTYETNFILNSSAQINKTKNISLSEFTINATANSGQYFVLLENYGMPNSSTLADKIYSVFASGNGAGLITSISPDHTIKENLKSLSGDYLLN